MPMQESPVVRMRAFAVGHDNSQQVWVPVLPIPRAWAGGNPDRAAMGMTAGIGLQLLRVSQDV